ncbi:MAG: CPBP family intramembrane metalloprotease [Treponema sp.]|jgi:membrane protease YdiL (CAAX protease family)|nr:CPBP family intramembrane metalloprotease [Treponema sp.]
MENKIYPRIKNAVLLCLLFLGMQIGFGLLLGIIIGIFGIGTESIFYGIGNILLQLISFGIVILIGFKKTKQRFNVVFKFNRVSFGLWLAVVVFMIGFVILSSELDNILKVIHFLPMPLFLQNTFEIIMVKQIFIISIILVGVIPAFCEEMFFRGILLTGFQENYSEKKAVLMSALLFGIIHLNPWQFVSAFIIGIFSAWICIKTRSIVLSIYIHIFNNIIAVIALKYKEIVPIKGFNTAYSEQTFQPLWFDIIGIVITILGIILLKLSLKKAKNVP